MILVDTNVLVYAANEDVSQHEAARRWLDAALSGGATVGFAWLALVGFVRLCTSARLLPRPLTIEQATSVVDSWLGAPSAVVLEPTADHLGIMRRLLEGARTGGNLVNDAHLAALAIGHGATVVTYDTDFALFDGVDWQLPTAA